MTLLRPSLALLLFAAGLSADPVSLHLRPASVTVFPQGARVSAQGGAELAAGDSVLLLEGLPASLQEPSLSLGVKGPAGTKLVSLKLRQVYTPETVEARQAELQKQIDDLTERRGALDDALAGRQAEAELLKALGRKDADRATEQSLAAPKALADFTAAAGSVGRRLQALAAADRRDRRAQAELDKKIAALRQELAGQGPGHRQRRTAEAELDLPQAGHVDLSLAYNVPDAQWTPVYDLRLEPGAEPRVRVILGGEVRQSTGEDWQDVGLVLSTARPQEGSQVPEPPDWWLDYYQPVFRPLMKAARMMDLAAPAAAPAPAAEGGEAEEQEAGSVASQTLSGAYAVQFAVKRRGDVPSGGEAQRVGLADAAHPADLTLVAVPRLLPQAFVEAEVRYSGSEPLLPGPAQIFREGEYVGQADLKAVAPGETFHLGFGADPLVKVERKLLDQKAAPGQGFLFAKDHRRYHWRTTVTNFHDSPRSLELREQLPRSRQNDIKVETLGLSPEPLPADPDKPGLVRWALTLPSKKEVKVDLRYDVHFPEGRQVTGLE